MDIAREHAKREGIILDGWSIREGDPVCGYYHGTPYTGIVRAVRPHTIKWDRYEVSINLSKPIDVLGLVRDRIIVATPDDYDKGYADIRKVNVA